MNPKLKVNSFWLKKASILLAIFGLLTTRDAQAIGLPPLITVPPVGATVQSGDTVTFTAVIGVSLTPLTIEWHLNGNGKPIPNSTISNVELPIVGTTITTLTITNVTSANAGNYSVKVENSGGWVTSGNALLTVLPPNGLNVVKILTQGTGLANGGFRLQLLKPATSNCVIDATTDFQTWTPIYTNSSASTNVSYLDSSATNLSFRYYRARLQ